ncbi:MAG TPA: tetraacyldisaccharide 4'-kinase [Sulfurimonas sp.]|nr:tetraacyldisaccharide 4'-kinase [Sulfurimonas sp.]
MKNSLVFWVEKYFYNPDPFQKLLSFILLPLSFFYCFLMWLRFKSKVVEDFGLDIVSVGNLTVGGSGKTPLIIALAASHDNIAIILRGYGRSSSGLYVVKDKKNILCDVSISGDEAMIYAHKLPNAVVIVSENRKEGIKKAKEMGVSSIFLDDAYSKHDIKKRDILIEVKTKNSRCLPSGAFRERLWKGKQATVLVDGVDFKRRVTLIDTRKKMSLVTAIARPERLDEFLPEVVSKNYFADHHSYKKEELLEILQRDKSDSLLVTYKDFVKVQGFDLPLSLLDLDIDVSSSVLDFIQK